MSVPQAEDATSKDGWDKLNAISGLITGGLVAAIGILATLLYNRRQLRVSTAQTKRDQEVQTVEVAGGLVPFLASGDPRQVEAALVLLTKLGSPELAAQLSVLYQSEGGFAALDRLAHADATAEATVRALNDVLDTLSDGVLWILRDGRPVGSAFAVRERLVATADYNVQPNGSAPSLSVRQATGDDVPAAVVLQEHGMAILETVQPLLMSGLPLHRSIDLGFGSDVRVLTRTVRDSLLLLERGIVVGISDYPGASGEVLRTLIAEVTIHPGYGGAPVIDRDDRVVAFIYGRDTENASRGFLLPVDAVLNALDVMDGRSA